VRSGVGQKEGGGRSWDVQWLETRFALSELSTCRKEILLVEGEQWKDPNVVNIGWGLDFREVFLEI